jgi:hypothetical protein
VALAAFAVSFGASLFVLMPRKEFWDANDRLLEPVRLAFRVAAWSLVVEVLALTLLATGTL